jgi:hypothetical protein
MLLPHPRAASTGKEERGRPRAENLSNLRQPWPVALRAPQPRIGGVKIRATPLDGGRFL